MKTQLSSSEIEQAILALETSEFTAEEKIDRLLEMARPLPRQSKSAEQLNDAKCLYDTALALCHESQALTRARILGLRAVVCRMMPGKNEAYLLEALENMKEALELIEGHGQAIEIAAACMHMGLIEQSLAESHPGKIVDAIEHYQRALPTFNRHEHAAEFAILNNNLAAAYLSLPGSDARAALRETLAVHCFQAALAVTTIETDPDGYAMLQNKLGNVLHCLAGVNLSEGVENDLQALEAYDEALRVRDRFKNPLSYADTICDKAHCLRALPDYAANPGWGNKKRLAEARSLYEEASVIYAELGELEKRRSVDEIMKEVFAEAASGADSL